MEDRFDVAVIGGGVVGCAVARELSRYDLRVAVLEKELDVACGASSRNSGVLHAGFTYAPGTLRAACAVEGSQEFGRVAEELDVPFRRTGKLVVGFTDRDRANLLKFKAVGEKNGVRGLELIGKERIGQIDRSAGGEFAMWSPDSGILDPMAYTIALAENAAANGAVFFLGRGVTGAERVGTAHLLHTTRGDLTARWVVNAAGLYSGAVSAMLGLPGHTIRGYKGEYFVLDKRAGEAMAVPVYPAPKDDGGFATHATPTVDGNVLIGPDSYPVDDFEDYSVHADRLDGLVTDGGRMFKQLKREFYIRNFAGIRAKRVDPVTGKSLDFLVEHLPEAPGVVNLVGIESPGLTSALPLARRVVGLIGQREDLRERAGFQPRRVGIRRFAGLSRAQQRELIQQDPDYGEIVCRCEGVTRAEILRAIHNPLGAATVAGIKNRTRATMGRCQGGYCMTRITQLIEREKGLDPEGVRYSGQGSWMFTGKVR